VLVCELGHFLKSFLFALLAKQDPFERASRWEPALGCRSPEEFEGHAKHADPTTQLCSPSLEFFRGGEEKSSNADAGAGSRGLKRRPLLQTSSPASYEQPKPNSMARVSFKTVSRCGFTPLE
jgi:hypothetical protein